MARSLSSALWLLAIPAYRASALAVGGSQVHCIGGRAHLLTYDVEGDAVTASAADDPTTAWSGVRHAVLQLEPAPEGAVNCTAAMPSGDKEFCVGANQDASCAAASADLPLADGLACRGCFVGAAADLYYKLNYSALRLRSVEVGVRDVHVRGGLGLHMEASAASAPVSGSVPLGGAHKFTLVDTLVGCPVCVRVRISLSAPTALTYKLAAKGQMEATAGVALDANLGDSAVRWERGVGWTQLKTPKALQVSPVLEASALAAADLTLGLNASLQVDVDNIIWYHLNLLPAAPVECTVQEGLAPAPRQACLDGGMTMNIEHEADLHWNLLHLRSVKHHWGPTVDYEWSKPSSVHACHDLPGQTTGELVV